MSSIALLCVFATLLSLTSCQNDRPTPGPDVEMCVQQAATQDSFLDECLQLFMERENDATTLAVYCNSECISDLERAYTDCNAQDTRFLSRFCDDAFSRTLINAEFCVSQEVSTTPSLQDCQRQWFTDFIFAETQDLSVGDFCNTCGQPLGTLYGNCGPAVDRSSRLDFGPTFKELFQLGCAQDDQGRYCSDIVRRSVFPEEDRTALEEAAIMACENIGDECTTACRDAINELGCCAYLERLFRRRNDPMLPLELCGIPECPIPFSLDPPNNNNDNNDNDGNDGNGVQCNGGVSLSVSLLSLVVVALSLVWSTL